MIRRPFVLALVVLGLVLSGCARNEADNETVVDIIDATSPNPYRFIYEVEQGGESFRVQGLIEDDLRYKLQLSIDGRPALEQVVVDDAIAVRFLAPGLVDRFVDDEMVDVAEIETDVEGATVLDALEAQRWVIDPVGAPSLLQTARDITGDEETGTVADDPLYDSRNVLSYLRGIARGEQGLRRYDADSLEPTYRADEDPFLPPEDDSGVTRYDTVVFDLPNPNAAGGGTEAVFPGYPNFRRLAIYEKDGAVFAAREVTDATPRQVEDFVEYADALVEETAPPEVYEDFRRSVEQLPQGKLADFLLEGINAFRESSGQSPVRFRTMAVEIQDLGDESIEVTLPTDEPITASLAILKNMGRKPFVPDDRDES